MRAALDAYLVTYNTERPHQGRGMNGRTTWRDSIPVNDNFTDRQTDQAHAA